jgi:hypothetical protein
MKVRVSVSAVAAVALGWAVGAAGASAAMAWECVPAQAGQPVTSGGTGGAPSCASGTAVLAPTYVASGAGGKLTVEYSGVNVQIVSGAGSTSAAVNGRGNLVIGYDESPGTQTGSHNLVLGTSQAYTSYGSIIAGSSDNDTARYSTVLGFDNDAGGAYSEVTGGEKNTAGGEFSSIQGGLDNRATADQSSVGGGCFNLAGDGTLGTTPSACETSGTLMEIAGGEANQAFSRYSTITGGAHNVTTGAGASVSGGTGNKASGTQASVSGGTLNLASREQSSVSGGNANTASGLWSSITGGQDNRATYTDSVVVNGFANVSKGFGSTVAGGQQNVAGSDMSFIGAGCDNLTGSGTADQDNCQAAGGEALLGGFKVKLTGDNKTSP